MKKVNISTLGRLLGSGESPQIINKFIALSAGWYRIAQVDVQTTASIGVISYISNFQSYQPFSGSLIASTRYRSYGFIQLLNKSTTNMIDEVRIVYPTSSNDPSFIDLYYKGPNRSDITVILHGHSGISLLANVVVGEIPSGYTSYGVTL